MAGSPFTYPFYRLRNYLHSVRVSVEETRDEVRASRVEMAQIARLEAIASAQLAQLRKLTGAADARSANGTVVIPRIIHRVWPGDDPLPPELEAYGRTWAEHHPDWELKLWRPSDLPPLRNQALFDSAASYAERSDIARYELLFRFGGMYVDTDFECLRCFDDLIAEAEVFIGLEHVYRKLGVQNRTAAAQLLRSD